MLKYHTILCIWIGFAETPFPKNYVYQDCNIIVCERLWIYMVTCVCLNGAVCNVFFNMSWIIRISSQAFDNIFF